MAIDRQDGRHFCDPWGSPGGGDGLVTCECGRVWALTSDNVYEEVPVVAEPEGVPDPEEGPELGPEPEPETLDEVEL